MKVLSHIINLLPKFVCHQHNDMFIEGRHLWLTFTITILLMVNIVWLQVFDTSLLPLLSLFFTINLHDVINDIEVVVNCIATREDVLGGNRRLLGEGAS